MWREVEGVLFAQKILVLVFLILLDVIGSIIVIVQNLRRHTHVHTHRHKLISKMESLCR